tara:strand:- start:1477 stop:1854 length:378 start_codon:yes stop_codon:yes gene_type:complete
MKSAPPPLKMEAKTRARVGITVRTLDMPEQVTIHPTVFEKGCYYATTTRDVMTMNVYFLEVLEVYGDTIIYRIAPQALMSPLTLESANAALNNVDTNVGQINTSSFDSFQGNNMTFYLSLMTKLV